MTNSNNQDTHITNLGGNIVVLYDPEVGQWILAKDVRHTKDNRDFRGFAFWRDGLHKLGREIRRRPYMNLMIPEATINTVSLEAFFLKMGLPTMDERVFGGA